ncbi:hypothetical protein MMB17_11890 [Methylobacterium organophilum]|uniref:hypothetical protein n=1 Tax=Methylobacterium organophilum TaxID=410 RepID=UPI001F141AB3|nr:hypothetical protein [Methylobacterium organophilum]UMY19932.1 hypothetical protein MMB17_11890 [Methylobacterium organophilum]
MHRVVLSVTALVCLLSGAASAQTPPPGIPGRPYPPGTIIQRQTNTTGNSVDYVIAPGATGADTITTNSAAGGNAGQPERAIPQGSGGGGTGGSSR